MRSYTTDEIAEIAGVSPARVRSLARDGVLGGAREGRAYRFEFTDLVLLRTARDLIEHGVRYERLRRSLRALRRQLPEGRSLTAVRVRGLGRAVVVEDRGHLWEADSGQGLLALESAEAGGVPRVATLSRRHDRGTDTLFYEALELEEIDAAAAAAAYRSLIERDPRCAEAHLNLGRLLQAREELDAAAAHYDRALDDADYAAIARFNLGTVREEQGERTAAIALYLEAAEGGIADAHYNLARLYELEGDRRAALRHLIQLTRSPG